MIVDCFTFFNEIDMLRVRLAELDGIVDRFVIVEAGETHAGVAKPFNLEAAARQFAGFLPRIVYVKLPRLGPLVEESETARFRLENAHRNGIQLGLNKIGCAPDDIVLVSDIDEIPSRAAMASLLTQMRADPATLSWTFNQFFHKLYFDETMDDGYNGQWWGGTVATRHQTLAVHTPQQLRRELGGGGRLFDAAFCAAQGSGIVEYGGWHLSSFGGHAVRSYKLVHYVHGGGHSDAPPEGVLMTEANAGRVAPPTAELRDRIAAVIDRRLYGQVPVLVRDDPLAFRHFFKCAYPGG